jgi:CubicO group peptidase (beta-lactamase class C family)
MTDTGRKPPAAASTRTAPAPRRRAVALAVAALTAVALAALTPWPRGFQGTPTGDAELMAEVEQALGSKHWQHIAAARVDGDEVAFAGTGADEHTEFEIGSITKTFTAALFADAIDRGEIDADTRLGEVWPDLEGKVAEVSLESIAMQRSGLPAQKPWSGFAEGLTSILANYVRADPYRASPSDVVAGLDRVEVGDEEPEYSNFGFAVLGQALAEVTGQDYAELVRTRITEPLGMDDTFRCRTRPRDSATGSRPRACRPRRGSWAATPRPVRSARAPMTWRSGWRPCAMEPLPAPRRPSPGPTSTIPTASAGPGSRRRTGART